MAAFPTLLLSLHVLAAILAVGTLAVAASLFPRYALRARGGAGEDVAEEGRERAAGVAAFLHRVCRTYAVAGLAVPVLGMATGSALGVLTDAWLIASMLLTTAAALLLALAILPVQRHLLGHPADGPPPDSDGGTPRPTPAATAASLAMRTGVFNLLWAIVVVLMIARPGSA
ncbi:membrane protein [Streptomyces chumphonensis]|uniref:Integral membrane protein n=1 Tax=Streptomyces chumphonensis TaxID=1214925 RepID=A0A927F5V1_9ACTN|nr:hypothetical protein [Streptomyces chumphonensis]MBD3934927.1 hypothetical protein [Streptomyces chumphonensis]